MNTRGVVVAIFCLLFSLQAGRALANERASLTVAQAMDLCDDWVGGRVSAQFELPGWRRMASGDDDLVLLPASQPSGEMRELQLFSFAYPTVEIRACAFTWRISDSAHRLDEAAGVLRARGFEVVVEGVATGDGTALGSRVAEGMSVARVAIANVPCRDVLIGPLRENCVRETVAEFSLYVSVTRPRE